MGYRDNTGSGRSNLFNTANPLVMLVVLQITFFILMNFLKSIYVFSRIPEEQFYRNIYHWFVMPADPMQFITRPWTLITMQFTEVKVILVISNLIWLWTFGYLIQDLIGNDKIIPLYIYSATISGIAFLGAANVFYPGATQSIFFSGAVSGIIGLAAAATTVSPQYRFFPMIGGGIPLWIIALIYLLLNLSSAFSNPILLLPVAAGGLTGFVYIRMLQKGNDPGEWMNAFFSWVGSWFTPKKNKGYSSKQSSFYNQGAKLPFVKKPNITQERIDTILDKINQKGYDKLTEEEKKILKEASKKDL